MSKLKQELWHLTSELGLGPVLVGSVYTRYVNVNNRSRIIKNDFRGMFLNGKEEDIIIAK